MYYKYITNLTPKLYFDKLSVKKTGNRESGVGSRESGVGSRESGVGSRESRVGSRESGVGSRKITTNEKRKTNHEQRQKAVLLGQPFANILEKIFTISFSPPLVGKLQLNRVL